MTPQEDLQLPLLSCFLADLTRFASVSSYPDPGMQFHFLEISFDQARCQIYSWFKKKKKKEIRTS